jgi:GT2 family glycosyltransferase
MANDVAVVIINHNSSEYTVNCVQSIHAQTAKNIDYEVIIIDNASRREEVKKLSALHNSPHTTIKYSDRNLGFGAANMLGASQTKAKYLFFLNNDCLLLNDCITVLKDFCDDHPATGMCGPQMFSADGKKILSFNYIPTPALKFLGPSLLKIFNPSKYPKRSANYQKPLKVQVVPGSAMFMNSKAFSDIGGFDPGLFFYCEEEDLAVRMKAFNWDIYVVPDAKYIHYGGGSSKTSFVMLKEYYISLMYFFRKHYSTPAYVMLKLLYAVKLLKKSFTNVKYWPFVSFILRGAPVEESLRYQQ